jgi:hypothetical protein
VLFFTIAPGWKRAEGLMEGNSEGNLHNSRFAMMYDVLVPDSPQPKEEFRKALFRYPAAILVGDYPDTEKFRDVLADYKRAGGRLMRVNADMLPPFDGVSAIREIWRGERKFPKVEAVLEGLQKELFPFEVSGDCQYGANKTADGWWLWVFNNKGVIKFADEFERIDRSKDAAITVKCRRGKAEQSVELISGRSIPVADGCFSATVPAGDIAVFAVKNKKVER